MKDENVEVYDINNLIRSFHCIEVGREGTWKKKSSSPSAGFPVFCQEAQERTPGLLWELGRSGICTPAC